MARKGRSKQAEGTRLIYYYGQMKYDVGGQHIPIEAAKAPGRNAHCARTPVAHWMLQGLGWCI